MKKIIGSFLLLLGSLGALVGCKEKEMIFIPSVTEQEICEEELINTKFEKDIELDL